MKVLITGASGFLGRHVLTALRSAEIDCVTLGRTPACADGGAPFFAADMLATSDFAPLMKSAGASHLLHLAWVTEHGSYWTSTLNLRWVDATLRLVQAFCEGGGQHVVVAGTCAEYAWGPLPCGEDETLLAPATLYGTAKDATRRLVAAMCTQHQVRCAWGRIFFPFGAGEGAGRLLPRLVETLQQRAPPFGVDAQAQRDFLYAPDVAQALVTLLCADAGGCFNIGSGQATRVGELVETLAGLLASDSRRVLDQPSGRTPDAAVLVADNRKLRALGWQPHYTLVQALHEMLRRAVPPEVCGDIRKAKASHELE